MTLVMALYLPHLTGLREEKSDEAELSRDRRPAGVLPDLGGEAALLPGVDAIAVARDGVETVDSKEIVANKYNEFLIFFRGFTMFLIIPASKGPG